MAMDRDEEEDDAMVNQAITRAGTIFSQADEMRLSGRLIKRVRELTKTINEHGHATAALQQKTNELTDSVKTLTALLVILTVLIAVVTVVMAWPTILSLWPKAGGR